jgi:ligand-binding SRPBCC domain-containing protein
VSKIYRLEREQIVPADLDSVWEFFATPRNLNLLTPPEMHFEILYGDDEPMHEGQIIEYRIQLVHGVRVRWLTEITHVELRDVSLTNSVWGRISCGIMSIALSLSKGAQRSKITSSMLCR